jgi:Fe-S-cluster containining protein
LLIPNDLMDPCFTCPIDDLISYCCHTNPVSKESKALKLKDGRTVNACPNLDELGNCRDYENRPDVCRDYAACERIQGFDVYELMMINRS